MRLSVTWEGRYLFKPFSILLLEQGNSITIKIITANTFQLVLVE
jgi:hypothetical protein